MDAWNGWKSDSEWNIEIDDGLRRREGGVAGRPMHTFLWSTMIMAVIDFMVADRDADAD